MLFNASRTAFVHLMYLSLEEKVHPPIAPHSEVRLHALDLLLQEAVEGSLGEHAPPGLDGDGCFPEAPAIFPHARVNSNIGQTGRWVGEMGG